MYNWFRETFGGLHKKYSVEPDMAMFGKAMGGYAITAVIGRREIMSYTINFYKQHLLDRKNWSNSCFKNTRNYGA